MTDLLRETVRTKDKNFSLARIEMEMTTCDYYEAFVGVEEAAHLLEALTEKIQLGSIGTARLQNSIQIQLCSFSGYTGKRIGISSLRNWWVPLLAQLMKKDWFITRRRQATGSVWEYICHENQYKHWQQNSMRHSGRLRRSRLELWPDNIRFTSKEIYKQLSKEDRGRGLGIKSVKLGLFLLLLLNRQIRRAHMFNGRGRRVTASSGRDNMEF